MSLAKLIGCLKEVSIKKIDRELIEYLIFRDFIDQEVFIIGYGMDHRYDHVRNFIEYINRKNIRHGIRQTSKEGLYLKLNRYLNEVKKWKGDDDLLYKVMDLALISKKFEDGILIPSDLDKLRHYERTISDGECQVQVQFILRDIFEEYPKLVKK